MVFVICVLTNYSVNHCFKDVLFGKNTVHVLYKLECFVHLVILQVVNHQVKASFWDHIQKRWQHLKGVFSLAEDYKIVAEQVIILKDVSYSAVVLK